MPAVEKEIRSIKYRAQCLVRAFEMEKLWDEVLGEIAKWPGPPGNSCDAIFRPLAKTDGETLKRRPKAETLRIEFRY
jgi:hypothetical protein